MLTWFSPYKWLAVGLLVSSLLAALGVQTLRLSNAQKDLIAEHFEHSQQLAKELETADLAQAANRAEEQRRIAAQREIEDAHARHIATMAADRDAATAAARSLSERVATLVTAGRRQAAGNSKAVPSSPPADDAAGMLALVLGRADDRAQLLAEFADRANLAGLACQQEYDSLTP